MRSRFIRHTLVLLVTVLAIHAARDRAWAQASSTGDKTRPNILWIVAEDMGPDLGVYGTPEVHTPNLDRLAGRGMLFTRAFTTAPVCSPSRSAWNTGMYQTTIGAHNHRSHRQGDPSGPNPLPQGVRLISDWLRGAGYFTANVVHFPAGIDFQGTGKTDWNFTYTGKPFDTDRWSELKAHQPFYAQINLPETHRGGPWWDSTHVGLLQPADPTKVVIPPYYPDHPVVRQDWAQYLNGVMALDRKVGVVLDLLRKEGLAENTIVVVLGDNGRAMVRGKQWPYDSGLHIPLIVHWPVGLSTPAGYRAGMVSGRLISAIDLVPTMLAAARVSKPPKMQGRVLFGSKAEAERHYVFGGRDRGDETVDRIRTVRSQRFRYLRNYYPERPFLQVNRYKEAQYPTIWVLRKLHSEGKLTPVQERLIAPTRPREELYDLEKDPYEIRNLADQAAYHDVVIKMRRLLDDWIEESNDQGRFPEDLATVRFYESQAKRNNDERIEALRRLWSVPP